MLLALVVSLISLIAPPAFSHAGPEEAQMLMKAVGGSQKSIGEARQQLGKTLTGYNSIMELTVKDTKDAYKNVGKDVTESEKKVGDAKVKVDEMNTESARYFTAWKESAAAGKDARQSFDTLITDLKNQSTFLGPDLNYKMFDDYVADEALVPCLTVCANGGSACDPGGP
jgi:hypothetical protein